MSAPPLFCIVDEDEALRLDALAFGACHRLAGRRGAIETTQMQGMTDPDLRQAMFARGLLTPVMIITALADAGWRKRTEAGAVFLRKPRDAKSAFGLLDRSSAMSPHPNQTAVDAAN